MIRKQIILFFCLVLCFASISPRVLAKEKRSNRELFYTSVMPVYSMENGEKVGQKSFETSVKIENKTNDTEEVIVSTKIIAEDFQSGEVCEEYSTQTYTFKKNRLVRINNKNIELEDEFTFILSEEDFKKIKPIAQKFRQGILTYDKYIEEIEKLSLDINKHSNQQLFHEQNSITSTSSGGLSWVTYYYKSSRGGYWLRAAKMKGYWEGGLNAFMLDSSAVVSGTTISKHNYLQGSQGGLVSSFMTRADAISSARSTLLIEAAALMGALGVAVLTVSTIFGALTATGSAAVIAANMISVSNSAHADIQRAYELATVIKSK
ncbi:hypothetical protein ACPF7I_08030 [Anoxybacillus sp. D401a]|uniref:hypothetical protein n=1 Tax=Anoxybacillus sp. D401a TaxID=575112 RepID=UPI003D355D5E